MSLRSILIIDDNETDRYLLKRLIKQASLTETIFEAENGREALDFLTLHHNSTAQQPEGYPPMLIFLDINMPIMGGFEFLEKFGPLASEHTDLKSTVLTMFTSSANNDDKRKALQYDVVKGFMVKLPRSGEELRIVLREHFPDL